MGNLVFSPKIKVGLLRVYFGLGNLAFTSSKQGVILTVSCENESSVRQIVQSLRLIKCMDGQLHQMSGAMVGGKWPGQH